MKIKDLEIHMPNWYGWKNKNTSLFEMWIPHWKRFNLGNCGITILPLHFWTEVGIWYKKSWRRFYFGCGVFSFFVSIRKFSKDTSFQN